MEVVKNLEALLSSIELNLYDLSIITMWLHGALNRTCLPTKATTSSGAIGNRVEIENQN